MKINGFLRQWLVKSGTLQVLLLVVHVFVLSIQFLIFCVNSFKQHIVNYSISLLEAQTFCLWLPVCRFHLILLRLFTLSFPLFLSTCNICSDFPIFICSAILGGHIQALVYQWKSCGLPLFWTFCSIDWVLNVKTYYGWEWRVICSSILFTAFRLLYLFS